VQPHHAWEQLREEASFASVAQEGSLGLYASQLLQESQGQYLGVRAFLEGLVAVAVRVEELISVVDEAQEDAQGLFQGGERVGMLSLGHPGLLWSGSGRMAYFLLSIHATRI
jgi:hypothetical protein